MLFQTIHIFHMLQIIIGYTMFNQLKYLMAENNNIGISLVNKLHVCDLFIVFLN